MLRLSLTVNKEKTNQKEGAAKHSPEGRMLLEGYLKNFPDFIKAQYALGKSKEGVQQEISKELMSKTAQSFFNRLSITDIKEKQEETKKAAAVYGILEKLAYASDESLLRQNEEAFKEQNEPFTFPKNIKAAQVYGLGMAAFMTTVAVTAGVPAGEAVVNGVIGYSSMGLLNGSQAKSLMARAVKANTPEKASNFDQYIALKHVQFALKKMKSILREQQKSNGNIQNKEENKNNVILGTQSLNGGR